MVAEGDVEALQRAGTAALQAGDGAAARRAFEALIAKGQASAASRLLLAQACRMCGDAAAETQALDLVLAEDRANLAALLGRARLHAQDGDTRAAVSFYQAALAAGAGRQVPQALAAELHAAAQYVRQAAQDYEQWLRRTLAEQGFGPDKAGPRFAEAVEILFGRKQVFPQQPSIFYYPGLPQIQFFDPALFPWVAGLESATGVIREELLALLKGGADFRPYVEAERNRPYRDFHGMQDDSSWGAFYLWKDGRLVEENGARCPKTVEALSRVPMTDIGGRTPSVLFSLLRPGAHIPPHHGMLNCRLICHLPLIVPPGCWLRVGNENRSWEEGRLLAFDDSIEHEAKNGSSQPRVVLLFDIWRPELSEQERGGIAAMFHAIDAFQRGTARA
jgi:hypothetical protein